MGNTTAHCEGCDPGAMHAPMVRHESDPCAVDEHTPYLQIRYYLIGVFGLAVCSAGIIFNVILLKILLQRALRTTYLIYLFALAIIDINISITYIVVMSWATWYEYFSSYLLYYVWHVCLPYFFTLSRIATLASTYLLVACTAERYLEVVQLYAPGKYVQITQSKRYVVISCVILASIAFRLVVFWELDIIPNDHCEGTLSYFTLNRTWLIHDFHYSQVYSFYVLHIVQVFFPFLALLMLNLLIVQKWKIVLRRDSVVSKKSISEMGMDAESELTHQDAIRVTTRRGDPSERSEIRKRLKYAHSARVMMIAIVTSYLLCNLLNLVITFLEHLDLQLLHTHRTFYSFASDAVTLLTAVNASLRLPIYYGCNLKIRSELVKLIRQYSRKGTVRRRSAISDSNIRQLTRREAREMRERYEDAMPLCQNASTK